MKKKFSVAGLVFLAICTIAATIQWYSDQPSITRLEDSMVLAVERATPKGYRSITLASLRDYALNNVSITNYTIYSTNFWISNSYVSNYVVTNVYNDTYASNFFLTQNFVTNQYSTNVTITNWYAPDTYVSNFFNTNIYVNDTYVSNYFTTNIYNTVVTNVFNYLYVSNAYVTNITAKNLQVHNIYADNGIFTNGITNLSLTANTIVKSDANSALASVPNGSGALTNDGSGNFGWSALSGGDQVWTNDAGTARLVSGGATNIDASPYFTLGSIAEDYAVGNYEILVGHDAALSGIVNFDQIWEMASDPTFTNDTYIQFSLGQTPVSGSIWMSSTDGIATNRSYQFNIQMSPTGGNNWIKYQTNYTDIWVVDGNGVVTANAYVATEYAWSGPTNEIGIGEFTYTANTPCAVTNLTTTGSALLSITNASSSNITFTVHSPIKIPYGETSRSYTITNGDVFFGSFRKGVHGSVFVPRGFYNP